MKKGFTLVELSIVLVIIGLLIGGILVAQSMISTTKIQGVVRQLQQYDVAVANFQTKYGQLPGDSTLFPNNGLSNNNGLVEYDEIGYFWSQLSQGVGLKNNDGTDFQGFDIRSVTATQSNCPSFNIDQVSKQSCLSVSANDWGYGAGMKNYYSYSSNNPATLHVLKSTDALAIDQKIDDGMPNSGHVYGNYNAGGNPQCITGSSPPQYDLSYASLYECYMAFELGTTNGTTN